EGDGWQHPLDELARYYESVVTSAPPQDLGSAPKFATEPGTASIPAAAREHAGLYLEAAALLGRRTAELHLALAMPTEALSPEVAAAFTPEPFTPEALAADASRI